CRRSITTNGAMPGPDRMTKADIFDPDYREIPFWWDAYEPGSVEQADVPREAPVMIIGAGYAGLATALELSRLGIAAVVIDAEDPGFGASTRSGGLVGGAASIKKPLISPPPGAELASRMMSDARDGLALVERLIAEEEIDCGWYKTGRFTGAWSRADFRRMQANAERLNRAGNGRAGNGQAQVIAPERQREEIGSDLYYGGLVTGEAGHLHPALYFKGLLEACLRRGITICPRTAAVSLKQSGVAWCVKTTRGEVKAGDVVIATNGYTGNVTPQFKRRVIPLRAYIIATQTLPSDLAQSLSPKNRSLVDTKRVVSFFRLSSDRRRLIYGSRVKWRDITPTQMAPFLYRLMVGCYPQLAGTRLTHAWTGNVALTLDEQPHVGRHDGLHYALGCNGSGVAMMTYLGTQLARKIAGGANYACAFDTGKFPANPFYSGNTRWFLPAVGNCLRLNDWLDRKRR
ncbi:MAG: NAD(P)/FAD-dependent oxidoreductase, partial [Aestuariivirgaceae bacterium]